MPVVLVSALEDLPAAGPAPPSFQAIYQAEFEHVWHSLRRLGIRESDLDDLTHDVFVTVHRRLEDYDPSRPLRPWLFGIALRMASDYRRSARYRREVPDVRPEIPDETMPADEQLAAHDARRLVAEALDTLDLDARAVFVMHEIDEHTMPEIAAAIDAPLNTLYSRLRLARNQFALAARRIRLRRGAP